MKRIGIFGSYAHGEQTPESDLNILVELDRPLGWGFVDLHCYLEELLGVKVHLATLSAAMNKSRLWRIIKEEIIYI